MKKMWLLLLYTFFQCYCLEYIGGGIVFYKALSYCSFVLLWFYSLIYKKNRRVISHDKRTRNTLKLIAIFILFSIFPAFFIEDQSISTSIMTTIGFVFVMLNYEILRRLNISPYIVERILLIFSFIYLGVVVINIFTFPNMMFGNGEMDFERGGIRIRSNLLMFGVFSYFYFLYEFFKANKLKYLIFSIIMFIAVATSLFRVYILLMLGLAAILFFKNISLHKGISIIIPLLLIVFFVIPKTEIYNNLVEVSKTQKEVSDNTKEDVRLQAYRYFVIESQSGIESILFGHGVASLGHSDYGKREELRQESTGIYQTDAGWAGCFHDYGIFAVLSFAYLLFLGIFKKKNKSTGYLFYFYVLCFFVNFAHGILQSPIMLYVLVLSFYILNYKPLYDQRVKIENISNQLNNHC